MRKNQVDVITLGCSKNLVDSEQLIRQFLANGYRVSHNSSAVNGEIVVLNTCGFIGDAQEESINMILQMVEAKKSGRIGQVYIRPMRVLFPSSTLPAVINLNIFIVLSLGEKFTEF